MSQQIIEERKKIDMDWSMEDLLTEFDKMDQGAYVLIDELRQKYGEDAVKIRSGIVHEFVTVDYMSGWLMQASAMIELETDEVPVEST